MLKTLLKKKDIEKHLLQIITTLVKNQKKSNELDDLKAPPIKFNPKDPNHVREDGTLKGQGWLGPLKSPDGKVVTEYSMGIEMNGKETLIPLIVPTLTRKEVLEVLDASVKGKFPSRAIQNKAVEFARQRIKKGQSPFID